RQLDRPTASPSRASGADRGPSHELPDRQPDHARSADAPAIPDRRHADLVSPNSSREDIAVFGSSSVRTGSDRHSYDIDGLVRIKSSVRLPELEFFRSPSISDADIVIRTRPVGGWAPRL